MKNSAWLNVVETLSVIGSIGGSIASVVSQQVVFASIPLSFAVTLNLVNRRLLLDSINQSNQTAVAQLSQENVETQAKVGTLTEQLAEVQQLTTGLGQDISNLQDYTQITQSNQTALAQLSQENVATQTKLGTLTEQLAEVQQLTTGLGQGISNHQTALAQLVQEKVETQTKVGTLTEQLTEVQQLTTGLGQSISNLQDYTQITQSNQTAVAQLVQEKVETQTKLGTLTEQLAEVKQLITGLDQSTTTLQDYAQILKGQTKIAEILACLREIETCTQTIRINPNNAKAYYNRGLAYQRLEDKEGAIGDYTEAIRINPSYGEAYHARGLARADLGDKKGAIEDFREAAKFFFEEGDIANYQTAKDLSKKFHELGSQPKINASKEVAVEHLFS